MKAAPTTVADSAERDALRTDSVAKARRVMRVMDDLKAENVVAIDLRGIADFADAFVIATARSRAQMRAIVDRVYDELRAEGIRPLSSHEDPSPRWNVLDYGDVVAHVFDPEARALYRLEELWGDAPRIDAATDGDPAAS